MAAGRLRLLGGFEFLVEERPVHMPLSAQRVVAFLALRNRPAQRVHVASSLWPDSTERRAYASLRTALWRIGLRELPVVLASSTHLRFSAHVDVDLHTAMACAKRIVHRTAPSDPDDLVRLCDAGEVLPDSYEDWVLIERERFHQLRLHALESLSERCAHDGRFGEATEAGLAAVASDPLRESAHRVVIASHLAEDNTVEAARQYSLYRALVKGRLGLDPSPQMQELVRDLPVDLVAGATR